MGEWRTFHLKIKNEFIFVRKIGVEVKVGLRCKFVLLLY